jgi:hypothetical protein
VLWTDEDQINLDADTTTDEYRRGPTSTMQRANSATDDLAVDKEDPNLKNPNFIEEICEQQPNLTPNFPSQR